jgi:hypothetical protein
MGDPNKPDARIMAKTLSGFNLRFGNLVAKRPIQAKLMRASAIDRGRET